MRKRLKRITAWALGRLSTEGLNALYKACHVEAMQRAFRKP